jgi:hypothetical protein
MGRTICLVVLMHVNKRIKVHVAVDVYVWPVGEQVGKRKGWQIPRQDSLDTPVVPEVLEQWVAKEELHTCVKSNRSRNERVLPQS